MPNKPLLIFPTPTTTGRRKRPFIPPPVHHPTFDRQKQRLSPKFENIEQAFEARRAELLAQPTGAIPEQVLVLETVGAVDDFVVAVRAIPGMEWLGEWDEEDIPPDEDFYLDEEHREKFLSGRLYLVMTNQTAITELLSMWERYKEDPAAALQHGRAKWKRMFELLREIRPWGPEDRLLDTGILDDWKVRVAKGFEVVRFETELWYKENEAARNQAGEVIRRILSDKGGSFIKQAVIPEQCGHFPSSPASRSEEYTRDHLPRQDR